ncbi:unannotated protein [freshwater metagenome]|uniref:Unannotated protein n=1 Tax=freshwater metagenome TaxID=449393 RepID=A0A6J6A160_9ZZZZ
MITNQITITGPKSLPTRLVPKRWSTNSPVRTTTVIGTTRSPADGLITVSPLTADITEIAGVIIPSPKKSATPKRPAAISAGLTHGRLITAV